MVYFSLFFSRLEPALPPVLGPPITRFINNSSVSALSEWGTPSPRLSTIRLRFFTIPRRSHGERILNFKWLLVEATTRKRPAFTTISTMPRISRPNCGESEAAISNLLVSDYGNYYSIRAPTIGVYDAWPHWEVAFIPADLSLDMSVHRCAGPCLNVNGYLDSTLATSYAQNLHWLKGHQISWGTTLKAVHRIYAGQELLAADLANGQNIFETSQAHEGLTFDADLRTFWTPPVPKRAF